MACYSDWSVGSSSNLSGESAHCVKNSNSIDINFFEEKCLKYYNHFQSSCKHGFLLIKTSSFSLIELLACLVTDPSSLFLTLEVNFLNDVMYAEIT